MEDILSLTPEELAAKLKGMGQSAFRAKQLYQWLVRGVDYDGMTNIPRDLRQKLSEEGPANPVRILKSVVSKLDGTEKYLYELQDGNIVEGVTMRYNYGNTLCVSTQVGCRMGCKFCASTLEGCVRNLTPGELLGQIIAVNGHLHETDGPDARISNVVLMGSGEPLDNYDNVIKFLRLLNREDGLHTIWQTRVCRSRCAYRCTRLTTRFAAARCPLPTNTRWTIYSRRAATISIRPGGA